jgi:alanine-synthesizing transaminase
MRYRRGVLSRRLPQDTAPNEWTRALERRRESGARLFDLTDQNPTRQGLCDAAPALAALADPRAARYQPEARGLRSAREAVAGYYAGRGLGVEPDDIVLTSGTSEAYSHLFRVLCDPGDQVLVPSPGYPLLGPLAALDAVELAPYPLVLADRWRPDLPALERAIGPRTRAVVVVQPNHPTGSCLDEAEIAALDALCAANDVAVIADEVFGDFLWAGEASAAGPAPSLLGERRSPTFVLQGLSKLCGLPQLKLSWVALAGPAAARARARTALEWVADAYLSVGTPVQLALPALLEARHAFRARVLERVRANRDALVAALGACGARLLPAAGGWTTVVRLPEGVDAEALAIALLARDVVAHPGHFYDFEDDAHLVLSLIVQPEAFVEGAARIAAAVRER